MKSLIYFIIGIGLLTVGCSETDYLVYNDMARVQLKDTMTVTYTFVYEPEWVTTDTIYIQINTIGGISDYNRVVKFEQITEYETTYVRDEQTGEITDTIKTEIENKAVPGVHYLDFSDASLQKDMVVKANEAVALIPVVVFRDESLKENSYRLRLQLTKTNDFDLGERYAREVTIVLSDRLERFYSWRVDTYLAPAFSSFGKYSTGKHRFMVDVLNEMIDENWYQAIVAQQAIEHYKNVLKEALIGFNNNPDNIASGAAPLRENEFPDSPLVSFP